MRRTYRAGLATLLFAACAAPPPEARRAYEGAPPVIPHEAFGASCVECHRADGPRVAELGYLMKRRVFEERYQRLREWHHIYAAAEDDQKTIKSMLHHELSKLFPDFDFRSEWLYTLSGKALVPLASQLGVEMEVVLADVDGEDGLGLGWW